jgi:ubiquinol-cytochrome c reductase iron-sulfur subunit
MSSAGPRRIALAGLVLSIGGSITIAVGYLRHGETQLTGIGVAAAFAGLAITLVTWGNHLMPAEQVTGPREAFGDEGELAAFERELHDPEVSRRSMLRRGLVAAVGVLGAAAVLPLRSLGPAPRRSLAVTPWRAGKRLVTDDGRPVRAVDVPADGLVTVFPEGHPGSPDGQAVLIRTAPGQLRPRPGRADWSPEGLVAYSKLCTHAGCPVGLYEPENHTLLCPCHQSTFDVLDGARPRSGPAAVSLPQLPLHIDEGGFLVADGDFSAPVGPAYWERP